MFRRKNVLPLSPLRYYFFFEQTTQDSARFIDIAEKYKATGPEGHSQEKEKENRKQNSPDWIGTSTRETQQLNSPGWIRTSTHELIH